MKATNERIWRGVAEQILDAHPRLTEAAVFAALELAARALKADVTYPLPDQAA